MIPLDFGPKPIFSSKDAANWRKMLDYFFVGKISYYMVTPATSFCDADSKTKKLMGGMGCASGGQKCEEKTFFLARALVIP